MRTSVTGQLVDRSICVWSSEGRALQLYLLDDILLLLGSSQRTSEIKGR
jgi:hypothetical protein